MRQIYLQFYFFGVKIRQHSATSSSLMVDTANKILLILPPKNKSFQFHRRVFMTEETFPSRPVEKVLINLIELRQGKENKVPNFATSLCSVKDWNVSLISSLED